MVCVGTPIGANGRSDLSQLDSALRSLAPILEGGAPLVVRSTLPPGATRLVAEWAGIPTSPGPDQPRVPAPGHGARTTSCIRPAS